MEEKFKRNIKGKNLHVVQNYVEAEIILKRELVRFHKSIVQSA